MLMYFCCENNGGTPFGKKIFWFWKIYIATSKKSLNHFSILKYDKSILSKGKDVQKTTEDLIEKLVDDQSVNITLFYGEDISEESAEKLREKIEKLYPYCEVTSIFGGQPVYYYIVSVE